VCRDLARLGDSKATFVVGRQQYEARVQRVDKFGQRHLGVYVLGQEHSVLDICWNRKSKWQRFMPNEDFIRIGVVKRAMKIYEDLRKAEAGKVA